MTTGRSVLLALACVATLSWATSTQAAPGASPLVTPGWLKQHLHDKNLVVLDVYDGDQRTAFATGHIPGALFTDFEHDGWRVNVGKVTDLLPPARVTAKLIGSFGVSNRSHVVVVPGGRERADFNAAARIYWTFKVLGHDKVSILDGGDKAWFADAGNPLATGASSAKPQKFVAHFRRSYLATRADVKRAVRTHDALLIDTRPPAQFEGKAKSRVARVAGTLPGAVNLPVEDVLTPDWTRLADAATVDKALARAKIRTTGRQISFCNTGHLASGVWFLLHEVKGNKNVSLYDGSMSDWTSDPKLPVANQPRS